MQRKLIKNAIEIYQTKSRGGGLSGYVKSKPLRNGQIISIEVLVIMMIIAVFHKKLIWPPLPAISKLKRHLLDLTLWTTVSWATTAIHRWRHICFYWKWRWSVEHAQKWKNIKRKQTRQQYDLIMKWRPLMQREHQLQESQQRPTLDYCTPLRLSTWKSPWWKRHVSISIKTYAYRAQAHLWCKHFNKK